MRSFLFTVNIATCCVIAAVSTKIPTFSYNSNWSSPQTKSNFLDIISTTGLFYWKFPSSHASIYKQAYQNGLEFFQMTNREWPNAGEVLPNGMHILMNN